jgi:hypothetical protein
VYWLVPILRTEFVKNVALHLNELSTPPPQLPEGFVPVNRLPMLLLSLRILNFGKFDDDVVFICSVPGSRRGYAKRFNPDVLHTCRIFFQHE